MDIITIVIGIIMFGVLVFVHELGHFLVAKAFGVRVYEFAIGMGPAIFKKKKGETTYSVRGIPLGGYVRFEAFSKPEYESIEDELADKAEYEESIDDERSLMNKNPWKRMLVMFAGSFMNLLLALILLTGIYTYLGYPTTTLDTVMENMPAYEAGIRAGDTITAINGKPTDSWIDVVDGITTTESEQIIVQTQNPVGEVNEVYVDAVIEDGGYKIGIAPSYDKSIVQGVKTAFVVSKEFIKTMLDSVVQLFTGKAEMDSFAGPVGIISVVDQAVSVGLLYTVNLMAIISLNLAVLNLLPFPALDGGRIVITFAEILTGGKKLPKKVENAIHLAGFALLFSFIILLTFKDIGRLIGG